MIRMLRLPSLGIPLCGAARALGIPLCGAAWALGIPLCFLCLSHPALAQSPADLELAKRHFELGRTYYDQADYEQALRTFKESFRLSKKSALLFNIGKCHEAMQQLHEAIEYYQRWLRESGKKDANLSARIRNLRRRIEASHPKPPPKPTSSSSPPSSTAAPKRPEPTPKPRPKTEPVEPPVSTTDRSGSSWMTWTGWGLIGTAVASIGGSVVLGIFAKRKADAVERYWSDANRDWAEVKKFEDQGEALELGQIITLVVGIAAAGGGATLFILSRKQQTNSTLTIAPTFSPRLLGVAGSVRF